MEIKQTGRKLGINKVDLQSAHAEAALPFSKSWSSVREKAGRQGVTPHPRTPHPHSSHASLPHHPRAAAAPPSEGSQQAPGQIVQRLLRLCLAIHFKSVSRQPVQCHYAYKKKKKNSRFAPPMCLRLEKPSQLEAKLPLRSQWRPRNSEETGGKKGS